MVPIMNHITLQTGHVARQPRQHVSDDAMAKVSKMFEGILAGRYIALPGFPGYVVNGNRSGDALIVTLWHVDGRGRIPVLTTGVALDACDSNCLWESLCPTGSPEFDTAPPTPPTPWIADRLEPGLGLLAPLTMFDLLTWTGDWAMTLGWSWAEHVRAEQAVRTE